MLQLRNEEQAQQLRRFFKTAPGEYGYGDMFLGLKVPQTRMVAKAAGNDVSIDEAINLLASPWHEVRLCGLMLMCRRFERLATIRLEHDESATCERDTIVQRYLDHADRVNNWDLVDLSAPQIVGRWLMLPSFINDKQAILDTLAMSGNLWQQRISMVCVLEPLRRGDPLWCLRYAEMHLAHPHDLMHKAVGWMLREMGKHVSTDLLRSFLDQHLPQMSRTTLRYAIERLPDDERQRWLKRPIK
ncbi:MAG: DNA alkylation repair protein [Bacteroidales bacterium]|nr:DNA alkylation repair protein [Bacteroidales bacterium]